MTAPPAIDARFSLTVGEGPRAFRVEVDLALESGVLVLFGPSGAGKTLTLAALAGLRAVSSGHLRVAGVTLLDTARGISVAAHERRVGYVPQSQALFPFVDVAANVAFGLPRGERKGPRVKEQLRELGIEHLASARPASLSGGERQRVALARALLVSPRLLLLDEPFASVDEEASQSLRKLVREVIDRHHVPTVLVTHDVKEALQLGDVVVRFASGRTIETGAPREVLARHAVVVRGNSEGVELLEGGRARARLAEAIVEGPAEQIPSGPFVLCGEDASE
jgi:molybdate transport system ATP-binding protein